MKADRQAEPGRPIEPGRQMNPDRQIEPGEKEIDDILKILDEFTDRGESRLKIEATDAAQEGQVERLYHLGRCDVGSPWAKGQAFDVLDTEENE